ncbi:MAG: AMP-binding protein [Actinomycetota bacterium]
MELDASIDQAKWAMQDGRDVPWLLARQARERPDHPFLIWEPFTGTARSWTYAEFRAQVRRVAASLSARGVEFGDRVMIHLDNSPEFLLSWFACAELGAVAVSTNTRSVARDMEYFAEKARVVAAITSPGFARLVADTAADLRFLVVTADDAGEPPAPDARDELEQLDHVPFADLLVANGEPPTRATDPTAELGIQFTSGTTSRPKAVLWTHANATWGAETSVSHLRLRPGDVTLVMLPMFHTNAQSWSMLTTLWSGGTVVLQPRFSASRFWDVALRHDVSWVSMIPFCVRALIPHDVPADHRMRFWGIGARVPEFEERFGVLTLGWWGMTETITQGIVDSVDLPGPRRTIGRASPGYDISVRDPDGQPVRPGERGRLFVRGVRGVSMFLRYDGDPAADAAAFDDDGWFDTGDMIGTDSDGNLYFSDRAKDMLKVGAENVAASEVETVVMQTGLAVEVAVVGQPHAMLDEVPVAFLITTDPTLDHAEIEQRVIDHCAANLADFKVPRAVKVLDELPRSTIEKIAKNVLRDGLPTLES